MNKSPNDNGIFFRNKYIVLVQMHCSTLCTSSVSRHFIGCEKLKVVICWICSTRRLYFADIKCYFNQNDLNRSSYMQSCNQIRCAILTSLASIELVSFGQLFYLGLFVQYQNSLPKLLFGCQYVRSIHTVDIDTVFIHIFDGTRLHAYKI